MSYRVTIQGQNISLPSVSADPNWAAGQVAFNQAVASALQFAVGTYDIAPNTYSMVANSNTGVSIPGLSFPVSQIRSFFLFYNVYRTTSTNNEGETGIIIANYNANNSTGSKWEWNQQKVGSSTVTFAVSDTGQVSFTSSTLSGSNHSGEIGYYAKVIQQSY